MIPPPDQHPVVETPTFTLTAQKVGMTAQEIEDAIALVAAAPKGGVSLGGGLYKVRVPREGGGKSGGYRVITLYVADDQPVMLISVISKTEEANFAPKAMIKMKKEAKSIRIKK